MEAITYIIPGDPIPLARARYGNRRVWDSQKEVKLISTISLVQQHNDNPFFEGPIHMDLIFYIGLPHNRRKPFKNQFDYHYYKPDLDNLIKYVADIANGILYYDDCIISAITAKKIYDYEPRTQITVRELNAP